MHASTSTPRRRGAVLVAALLLGLLGSSLAATPARGASDGAPMLLGLAVGGDWRAELDDFTAQQGKPPAFFQLFWEPEVFANYAPWQPGQLRDIHARGITPWIEWTTEDLAGMAAGSEDQQLRNLWRGVKEFADGGPGRSVVVAPLPEANLDEHPWCCDPVLYQRAFRRMRVTAAEAGLRPDDVRFAFSMNGHSTPGRSYAQFYPGDEHVDLLAFARLNRGAAGPDGWRGYDDVFAQPIARLQVQVGKGKPIVVAQTGSVTAGGDRGAWLEEMFRRLKAHPQVVGAIYFNRLKSADFRVHSKADGIPLDGAFEAGYDSWSAPSAASWLFDGSLDQWVAARGGATAVWPPSTADQPPASNPFGRNLAATPRIGASAPIANANAVSRARFVDDDARHVVLSRADKFPDALAGTPLLGEGSLLLTPSSALDRRTRGELDRVLPDGGRVYLLGGPNALAPAIEDELTGAGYDVVRLAGSDRFQTARAIALEVTRLYPASAGTVLVARGFGTESNPTAAWADSVTGGGFAAAGRHPVVLSLSHELSAEAADVLDGASQAFLLGGPGALQDAVLTRAGELAGAATRIAGSARDATAVEVLRRLWGAEVGEGRFIVIDGYSEQGWAFGLPAAGLAAEFSAPLLPVHPTTLPPDTAKALTSCFRKRIATVVVGTSAVVSDGVLGAVEGRDHSCG